jgi:hypothetical protein
MPSSLPTQAEALCLHQRLLDGDPVAPTILATSYLEPLIGWLTRANRGAPADLPGEAAGVALVALIKNPATYNPARMHLFAYLCMSAQGDLQNLWRQEARHCKGRISLESVEHGPDAGKYFGREDDPALRLSIAEAQGVPANPATAAVLGSATEMERRALELMLRGEFRTAVFAAALGLADRPMAEQEKEVKRIKDRLKARLKRERGQT